MLIILVWCDCAITQQAYKKDRKKHKILNQLKQFLPSSKRSTDLERPLTFEEIVDVTTRSA